MQIKRQQGSIRPLRPRELQRHEPGRSVMTRLRDRIDALMAAVTFAEEGEVEIARRFAAESRRGPDSPRS